MKKVFACDLEVKITPVAEIYEEGITDTFVFCFCYSLSRQDAISTAKQTLMDDGIVVTRFKKVWEYAGTKWDGEENQREFDAYAEGAVLTNQVIFSPFMIVIPDRED